MGRRPITILANNRALGALARLPPSLDGSRQACDLRSDLATSLYFLGQLPQALGQYREALTLAEALDDDRRRATIVAYMVYLHGSRGHHAEAVQAGELALALARSLGDTPATVWASMGLSRACLALGNYHRGIECGRMAVAALAREPIDSRLGAPMVPLAAASSRTWLALCLARTGDLEEGLRHGEEAVRIADAVGGRLDQLFAYYGLARVRHAQTDFEAAVTLLERAVALCEGRAFPLQSPWVVSSLASTYAQSGRVAEALPLLERALAEARSIDLQFGYSLMTVQIGETNLAAGRFDEASLHAAEALRRSRERGERGDEAWALHLHAEITAQREPAAVDDPRRSYAQALALAEDLGMRPLAARCRLSLGALELRAGQPSEARVWLSDAIDQLRQMGITVWQERAERLLATTTSS